MWELPTKKPESAAVLLRNFQNNLLNIQLAFKYTGLEIGDRSHRNSWHLHLFVLVALKRHVSRARDSKTDIILWQTILSRLKN
jgi:hypothetical protein